MRYDETLYRGWKSMGFAGPVSFLMVFWAASMRGTFDFGVFAMSLGALALCWARTWVLVPEIARIEQIEKEEWERYSESDWELLAIFAELSGSEIDQLRADVRSVRNDAVRTMLQQKAPQWTDEDRRRFLEYFVEDLSALGAVYVDEQGRIQAFD